MKRFIKRFFAIFSVVCIAFITFLHWSGFQKACLLGALRCKYKDVTVKNFKGGATVISWDKVSCKTSKEVLTISNFELKWHLWQLVFRRTLSIETLHGDIDFVGDGASWIPAKTKQAGWFLSNDKAKSYSILKNLQVPVKLDIASVALNLTFSTQDASLQEGHLTLQNLHPGQTGTLCYDGKLILPQQVQLVTRGEFALQSSQRGVWEKIRCAGELEASCKETVYPRLTFNGIIDGKTSNSKEEIKAEIHCGQANDFLLTGECVKDSDRVYDFKWQGFFDHSMLNFLNMSARPVLSILTEGNCVFNRKQKIWATHTNLSVWGKHFETIHPSLKSLPCLSFKAQLNADVGSKQVALKQYKFILKEKGAQRLFLDVTSLHPLTYIYKENKLALPSKEDAQIFEINFYETPFEIFNPYLNQYGFQIAGNLQSGNVNVGWKAGEKHWTIATFQPICAQIRQLKKGETISMKDIMFRLSEKSELDYALNKVKYDVNLVASDLKRFSFFKFSPKGYVDFENKTISGDGAFSLDNSLAKDLFTLEPWGITLNPNLLAKLNYDFKYQKEKLSINKFQLLLNSSADKAVAMELNIKQPLIFSKDCWKNTQEGDVVSLMAQNYPLNFTQYNPVGLFGTCNAQLAIKKIGDKLQCYSEIPLNISDFKWRANSEEQLSLSNVFLDFRGDCDEALHWSVDLAKANIVSDDETHPLLSGNCEMQGIKKDLIATKGQLAFSLDKLCSQPMMLKYPGFVGEFNSHWNFLEKQAEANGRLRVQPLGSNFTLEAKTSYKQAEKPLLKTSLELQSKTHASDIYADTTWDKNGFIDCQINSEHLFPGELSQCFGTLNQLSNKFTDRRLAKADVEKCNEIGIEKSSAPVVKAEISEKKSKKELPFQGLVHLNLKSIYAEAPFLQNVSGTIAIKKDAVQMEDLRGALCSGNVALKTDYNMKNNHLEFSFDGAGIDVSQLSKVPGGMGYPLDKYGQFAGNLDMKMKVAGEIGKPFSWHGSCDMDCKNGYYKAFNSSSKAGQAISGLASTLGLLLSANVSSMGAVNFITAYFQGIPFTQIACSCSRDIADEVGFKGLAINDDLSVSLEGSVGMKQNLTPLQQPLACVLKFSAPAESAFLNYFSFDTTQKDKNGYCVGPECNVGGTLGKPDYSALVKLVTSAHNGKSKSQEKASPVQQLLKSLF